MVNLGDNARRYRIVRLKARPSYPGRPNMEETAHFLSQEYRLTRPPTLAGGGPPWPTSAREFRLARPSRRSSASPNPRKGAAAFPGGAHSARSDRTPRNGQRPPVKKWSPDVAPGSHGRGRPTSLYGAQWATGQPAPLGRRRGLPTPPDAINSGYGDVRRVET